MSWRRGESRIKHKRPDRAYMGVTIKGWRCPAMDFALAKAPCDEFRKHDVNLQELGSEVAVENGPFIVEVGRSNG
jgi:hypothetical protein